MSDQLLIRLVTVVTDCMTFLIITIGVIFLMAKGAFAQGDATQISFAGFKASGVLGGFAFLAVIALFMVRSGLRPAKPLDDLGADEGEGNQIHDH